MSFQIRQDKNLKSLNEGVSIADNTMQIDYVGAGVSASASGNNVTATISGASGTAVTEEVPTGAINGINTAFTLANTPLAGTLRVFLNSARQQAGGGDFTLSGATITFVVAPPTGSILFADYNF